MELEDNGVEGIVARAHNRGPLCRGHIVAHILLIFVRVTLIVSLHSVPLQVSNSSHHCLCSEQYRLKKEEEHACVVERCS